MSNQPPRPEDSSESPPVDGAPRKRPSASEMAAVAGRKPEITIDLRKFAEKGGGSSAVGPRFESFVRPTPPGGSPLLQPASPGRTLIGLKAVNTGADKVADAGPARTLIGLRAVNIEADKVADAGPARTLQGIVALRPEDMARIAKAKADAAAAAVAAPAAPRLSPPTGVPVEAAASDLEAQKLSKATRMLDLPERHVAPRMEPGANFSEAPAPLQRPRSLTRTLLELPTLPLRAFRRGARNEPKPRRTPSRPLFRMDDAEVYERGHERRRRSRAFRLTFLILLLVAGGLVAYGRWSGRLSFTGLYGFW